ncbi:putative cysteine protease [Chaetomidium leptoderma]|uniref:Cysteine protease n=1 Tax=Chaetomidium leptoderma TaxID=669021 RepID=A0AAN6VSE6_9PEZI|nr:putative cysteine protease [Chaetomidium leptoderma]
MTPQRQGNSGWQSAISSTSPKLASAMEVAVAAGAEVNRVSRRIFQKIWDPEPINNQSANEQVWCLGHSYTLGPKTSRTPSPFPSSTPPTDSAIDPAAGIEAATAAAPIPAPGVSSQQVLDTPPDSIASSFDSSLAYEEPSQDTGWPPAFLDDFESRIWMTYRTGFELIPRSTDPRATSALSFAMRLKTSFGDQTGFSSDTGWGCMIRSGQGLLANALLISQLGRDWRRTTDPDAEREILSLFADDARAPYSLHNFVKHGATACGKYPGEWFGPSATARCIQALATKHESEVRIYSTGDLPDVYEDSFMATAKPDGETFHPTLILVCTRLGIDKINPVYEEALISTLQMEQSIGIAGGRPSSSLYFVGVQGQWLFYLDPHHPRPTLPYRQNPNDYTSEELDSCHTRRLRHLHVEDMDPSMLIGFLIKDEDDWDMWKSAVKHVQGKSIITVSPHDPARGMGSCRAEAIDEVETLSDDDDTDTVLEA